MNDSIQNILDYWFGELEDGFPKDEDRFKLWFSGGKATDDEIREQFGVLVEQAAQEELRDWEQTPQGRIAVIILLDQFTRNLYRGSGQAFAADPLAQKICLEGIEQGYDLQLAPIQRMFFYMPLEHSESRELHEKGAALFEKMRSDIVEKHLSKYQSFLDSVYEHKVIIDRFGRYPHRNAAMGRESTPEEVDYLSGDHKSFGQ